MPMRVSRIPKVASADASRMSHAVMRSIPPPRQCPCTAAITGTGQLAIAVIPAWNPRVTSICARFAAAGDG